ncbi:SMC-Scp complex subunit ScpB [Jeotgalibacillus sp. R-1-5s-1]|uniref:SMC-Scp complex subunit ScpB n=1 Tax=Jeotgalibacillus sp. R-1-5s-1 TaxID=2555897 RepID=UPI0010693697|nr:SMC-Scp complex subunit ScpB [Jeotgalibacillus sp. R-1-5s-1]TFE00448.1 SMC-Scp complex subunit ScpB [Jeotgalibacillus sp. R-1-5s-1]
MASHNVYAIVESLLFTSGDEGLTVEQLMDVLTLSEDEVLKIMATIREQYLQEDSRGIQLVEYAEKYQLATKAGFSDYIKQLAEAPSPATLSQASLETLAIIAYRQPVTKVAIEEIRGVKTDRPVQTLLSRGLIKELGRAEGAGRPILYGTTDEFLDSFGLNNLTELPELPESMDEDDADQGGDLFFESLKKGLE